MFSKFFFDKFGWLYTVAALVAMEVGLVYYTAPSHDNVPFPTEPTDFTPVLPNPAYESPVIQKHPRVIIEVLDTSLEQFAPMWRDEIARRFDSAVGILVHGGELFPTEWGVGTFPKPKHIQDVVKDVQKRYPGRTVVILACNPGHLKLGIPGVYYAHSSVWCVPDRALSPEMFREEKFQMMNGHWLDVKEDLPRSKVEPDVVGNIFEFEAD